QKRNLAKHTVEQYSDYRLNSFFEYMAVIPIQPQKNTYNNRYDINAYLLFFKFFLRYSHRFKIGFFAFNRLFAKLFQTLFADTLCKKTDFIYSEIDIDVVGNNKIFLTSGLFTDFTVKMQMLVFVGLLLATVWAKNVTGCIIFLNTMHYAFFF